MRYVYMGKELGGLPDDDSCYDENRKVDYDKMKDKDFFKKGLNRLITANSKAIKIAIMCSELNISIHHIIAENKFKSQEKVISELNDGVDAYDMFGNKIEFTSRKSYLFQLI